MTERSGSRRRWIHGGGGVEPAGMATSSFDAQGGWAAPDGEGLPYEPAPTSYPRSPFSPMEPPYPTKPSEGEPVGILDLAPGDRVRLPVMAEDELVGWSEPVTVVSVVLIDTALAEVRWEPEPGGDRWGAHALLIGAAFHAGARRVT